MKLGKLSILTGAALVAFNAAADGIYNTGYSTSVVSGQTVDNLWTITQLSSTPTGTSFPTVPYAAFVLPNAQITWPWDLSAPPAGANAGAMTWDSNQQPAFAGVDTNGMTTTYTLNFSSSLSGNVALYFETDNYLDMYAGSVSPSHLFYSEQPAHNGTDFLGWQSVLVPVVAGANELNIVVYNYPQDPGQNYTGLRVNFAVGVPEPSSMALAAGGLVALFGALKRRK